MKKRFVRVSVCFTLACLAALVLSHPYVWQNVFGPKIHGEPFWAWQQEFRAELVANRGNPTAFEKILRFLRIDSAPFRWIGVFPYNDPEMLPVLKSLVADPDENVRAAVASALLELPSNREALALFSRMLDDPSGKVRRTAILGLSSLCPPDERGLYGIDPDGRAIAALKKLMEHPDEDVRSAAEQSLKKIDPDRAARK